MITITSASFSEDYKSLNFSISPGTVVPKVFLYIGSCYLNETEVLEVTSYLVGNSGEIPIEDISTYYAVITNNCGYDKAIYDGIFTLKATDTVNSSLQEDTKAVLNLYYLAACMANSILAANTEEEFNELNLMYLFGVAATNYIVLGSIESALEAYAKLETLCNAGNRKYYTTEIAECSEGLGCWIVDGVYVKR